MIYISCAMKQDFVIECLEKATEDGIKFKYIEKKGIKMTFEVDTQDLDNAVAVAKRLIKSTDIGSVLYFQVTK